MQHLTSFNDRAEVQFLAGSEYPDLKRRHPHEVRLAVNEAEALACETEFPGLFVLDLAREKLKALELWQQRQDRLRPHPVRSLNRTHCPLREPAKASRAAS